MNFKIDVKGLKEVEKMLKQLPQEISDKVQLDINKKSAAIAKQELESAAPVGDNDKKAKNKIENSVIVAKGKGGKTLVQVGFLKRAFHVLFFTKGTKVRKTEDGESRGTMDRNDFVTPAHDRAVPKILQYLGDNYLKLVNRSLKRLVKKYK